MPDSKHAVRLKSIVYPTDPQTIVAEISAAGAATPCDPTDPAYNTLAKLSTVRWLPPLIPTSNDKHRNPLYIEAEPNVLRDAAKLNFPRKDIMQSYREREFLKSNPNSRFILVFRAQTLAAKAENKESTPASRTPHSATTIPLSKRLIRRLSRDPEFMQQVQDAHLHSAPNDSRHRRARAAVLETGAGTVPGSGDTKRRGRKRVKAPVERNDETVPATHDAPQAALDDDQLPPPHRSDPSHNHVNDEDNDIQPHHTKKPPRFHPPRTQSLADVLRWEKESPFWRLKGRRKHGEEGVQSQRRHGRRHGEGEGQGDGGEEEAALRYTYEFGPPGGIDMEEDVLLNTFTDVTRKGTQIQRSGRVALADAGLVTLGVVGDDAKGKHLPSSAASSASSAPSAATRESGELTGQAELKHRDRMVTTAHHAAPPPHTDTAASTTSTPHVPVPAATKPVPPTITKPSTRGPAAVTTAHAYPSKPKPMPLPALPRTSLINTNSLPRTTALTAARSLFASLPSLPLPCLPPPPAPTTYHHKVHTTSTLLFIQQSQKAHAELVGALRQRLVRRVRVGAGDGVEVSRVWGRVRGGAWK
ncbi:uncharacterized protein EV422DRAFT_616029 [Fimicolochytrium jonesii]|uniref:uncharacterized protein n=1 Tax=Fimicolochytrium jonesii TaxID=1396493 RepID=UPI0022FE14CD|nr:uncharacterized protein EV422DRAFT_616029 [Fimicolochytrium jonesii]KAI8826563.1 hypothetical protein EV422DRAFT_616029 [Fimicolochytrium jonesii]